MLLTLVTGALAFATFQKTDTSVAVSRGQRLEVNAFGGEIALNAWNRSTVRVEANTSDRSQVEISTTATTVSVRTQGRRHRQCGTCQPPCDAGSQRQRQQHRRCRGG